MKQINEHIDDLIADIDLALSSLSPIDNICTANIPAL